MFTSGPLAVFFPYERKDYLHSTFSTSAIVIVSHYYHSSRYEIFMDVVKPDNLNVGFLREFMMLPTSYYEPGAALKFRELNLISFYSPHPALRCLLKIPIRINCCLTVFRGFYSTLWNSLHQGRTIWWPT